MAVTDGGTAFPSLVRFDQFDECAGKYRDEYAPHGGMTLRDYFAGQALAGIYANSREDYAATTRKDRAVEAYRCADAMLAERAKVSQ